MIGFRSPLDRHKAPLGKNAYSGKRIQKASVASAVFAASCFFTGQVCADVAVIVSSKNNETALDSAAISNIFLGKLLAFPSGGTVIPIDQAQGNSARTDFLSKVLKRTEEQYKSYWVRLIFSGGGQPPLQVRDDMEVIDLVSQNPSVVGYVDAAAVTGDVKVVFTIQ
ncbi:Hypothetical protein HDN1F_33770 [gamma proteobacterium HdN1]|nr:Hypothetical protein HDN1F_33770 [gamma proteobacterium HdN1]